MQPAVPRLHVGPTQVHDRLDDRASVHLVELDPFLERRLHCVALGALGVEGVATIACGRARSEVRGERELILLGVVGKGGDFASRVVRHERHEHPSLGG